jgi:hypothetical protein
LLVAMAAVTYKPFVPMRGAAHGIGGWSCLRSSGRLQPFTDARDGV